MSTDSPPNSGTDDSFTRAEVQALRKKAQAHVHPDINQGWAQAFLRLAIAADILDAFFARSSVCPTCHPVSPPDDCKQEPAPAAGAVT